MVDLISAGNEAIASHASAIVDVPPCVDDRAGTLPSRCPHSTRADASPATCSLCAAVTVERVRPRDDAEAFAAALEALRPRRGRPRMHALRSATTQGV